ncbi:hypothetical protein [Brevundimonas naejangsanensis]|uniref:hypothetical protein n=1 Tax=Brevundimonas naejangsanensis TaxID=588932 RepID=UPI0026EFC095|nr:hypothetical protein [Brevundimonas naejangsanensis]
MSRLQACCAIAGLVVLLGAVAVLASAAFSKPSPADLTITRDDIRPSAGGWVVDIVVANHGDLAAAAVDIEGRSGDERSGVSLDYVPGRGEKKASLVFSGAQKPEPRLRVLGWSEP